MGGTDSEKVFRALTDAEWEEYSLEFVGKGDEAPNRNKVVHMEMVVPRGMAEAILARVSGEFSLYSSVEDFVTEALRRRIVEGRTE